MSDENDENITNRKRIRFTTPARVLFPPSGSRVKDLLLNNDEPAQNKKGTYNLFTM